MEKIFCHIFLLLTLFNGYLFMDTEDCPCLLPSGPSPEPLFNAKCPDTKTKTKACAFPHVEGTTSPTYQFLIFKKCGKGQYCDYENTHICLPEQKRLKNGKSCNYNEDCISGTCLGGKCGGLAQGVDCSGGESCASGLTCYRGECVKPITTVGTEAKDAPCGVGLMADKDGKCQKWGTLEDGTEIGSQYSNYLCKSGMASKKDTKWICDSIKDENKCKDDGTIDGGKWDNGNEKSNMYCVAYYDTNFKEKYYPTGVKVKSLLFEDFLKDYEKLKLEDINTKDKYAGSDSLGKYNLKWKTYKKYLLYKHAEKLLAAGLIDNEGKVADDKDCEFDFIMKNVLGGGYIKVFSFLFAFVVLLF